MHSEERTVHEPVDAEDAFLKRVYRDFGDSLRRQKFWILIYCVLVVATATIVTARQPSYYRATAVLLIDSDVVQDPSEQRSLSNLELQATIIQSPEVVDRVIEKANLLSDPVFFESHNPRETFAEFLEVETDKLNKTIKIHFLDTRPAVAALIANHVAQAYLYEKVTRTSGVNVESIESFKEQVVQEMEKLNGVKTRIAALNKEFPEFGSESVISEQIKFLNAEYIRTDSRALQLKATLAEIESLVQNGASIESQPFFVSHPRVMDKLLKIREAELDALEQEQEYRGMHPLVLKAKARLAALKSSLAEEKIKVVEELRADLKAAEATTKKIRENMMDLQTKEKELTPQKLAYKGLLTEEASISETIRLLNVQISNASVAASFKQTGIEILSYATVPQDPFKPNKPRSVLFSLLFAAISSLGFIFLKCYFDRTFRTEEDIEQLLVKPFLGHLPFIRIPKDSLQPNFRNEKESVYFSNFLRLICANIIFLVSGRGNATIMITGSRSGEGKSFTSYHIAHTFAQEGKKVVLVDVDFCRSIISFAFSGIEEIPGLHDYLVGKAEAEEIIAATGQPNLFLIQSREAQFSASHALRSDRMRELVHKLKQDFDVVLFDTPPVLATNDAIALGELVDLRILVVEWGKTPKELVQRALKKIAPSNLVLAAIILNKAKHWGSSYYYDHYYGEKKKQPAKNKKK
jgi:capsular exopolysaccharide synthesis family protein